MPANQICKRHTALMWVQHQQSKWSESGPSSQACAHARVRRSPKNIPSSDRYWFWKKLKSTRAKSCPQILFRLQWACTVVKEDKTWPWILNGLISRGADLSQTVSDSGSWRCSASLGKKQQALHNQFIIFKVFMIKRNLILISLTHICNKFY